MKKKIDIESFKDSYLLRDVNPDFAIDRRSSLRFAVESLTLKFSKLNDKGPEPFEYLQYARSDIRQSTTKGAINGLGNAKRAIHLTIKKVMFVWGLLPAFRKANFPAQLQILQELNAFPTKTLEALNRKRNIVEHEFTTIDIGEVSDLIDIAEMFLLLAYPFLKEAIVGSFVGIVENDKCYEWRVLDDGYIYTFHIKDAKFVDTSIGPIYYSFGSKTTRRYEKKIRVERLNKEDWLGYLDLLIYMTKKRVTLLEKQPFPKSNYFYSAPRRILFFELPRQ